MSAYEEAKAKYIDESLLVTDRACPEYARRNVENATAMYQAADKEIARIPDYKETVRLLRQERRQLDAELARLRELILHIWVHDGYENCGYMKMTTEQKQLYDEITNHNDS